MLILLIAVQACRKRKRSQRIDDKGRQKRRLLIKRKEIREEMKIKYGKASNGWTRG